MRGTHLQLCPFIGLTCPFLVITHACPYFLEEALIIERFAASENAFSFMSSVEGIPADLRWEELPYIINKLIKLGLSDYELKDLVIRNGIICKILTQYLWLGNFSINLKEIIFDTPLG